MLWLLPCVTTLLCVFRECIIPDISRTFHFGVSGNTMNPYFHDRYFKNHVINRQTDVALKDINRWLILWCVCGTSVNLLVTCHFGACVGDMCQCMCWYVSSCATSVHVLVTCITSVCAVTCVISVCVLVMCVTLTPIPVTYICRFNTSLLTWVQSLSLLYYILCI